MSGLELTAPPVATSLLGTGDAFGKGRDFAAWLGLVPRQMSTGDRTILGKISERSNRYLRVLFVQSAWVVLIKPKSWERYGLNGHRAACSGEVASDPFQHAHSSRYDAVS
jgi:transposase